MFEAEPQSPRRGSAIGRFFGALWRFVAWLRVSLANLVFLVLLLAVIAVLSSDGMPQVPERGALVIDPSGRLVEQLGLRDPLATLFGDADQPPPETLLKDVLDAIRHAKDDTRIAAVVLATDQLAGAGVTKTRDIAAALAEFRETGRKVIAVGDAYGQDQYILAAQADEIWMHPMGFVELSGYAAYRSYYRGLLDKLKIDFHVFRSGTFKSAMEPVERGDMSGADRLATGELLGEMWSEATKEITTRRKLPPEAVDHYANHFDEILERHGGDGAAAAMEHGLVDALKTRAGMNDALAELVGADDDGRFVHTGFRKYLAAVRAPFEIAQEQDKPAVGVAVASGVIVDGEQPPGNVGGDTLAGIIREAARDDGIKALVLRIDSPGGSGFASEIIREALVEFRATGKPLVASMGSVAASGGYWIAAPADEIWAAPTTVTGSIGVLSAFPSFSRGLAEIGITSDGLGTTALAGGPDPSRPLSPQWESVLRLANHNAYERFLAVVAEGRGMERQAVADVAEGRVWTGARAAEIGLVDNLGSLDDAVASAAKLAQLEDFSTRVLEPPADWRTALMEALSLGPEALVARIPQVLGLGGLHDDALALLLRTVDPRRPWAFCTDCLGF